MQHASTDTIYALSSAPGKAAVALVRISGPLAPKIARDFAGPGLTPRQAAVRTLRHPVSTMPLDVALVLLFAAPASATGEDVVEFHLHGGRAVLQAVLEALQGYDRCRHAEPGEFARRGFENGKFDLTAAEGIADLIDAETEMQRRQAALQASGRQAELYEAWRQRTLEAQALVEAAIDFADEADVSASAYQRAQDVVSALADDIAAHLAGANRGEIIRDGFRVVITGPPNAGKSSLLNALARRDAAIVSEEAGTTRDVIEVRLDLAGIAVIVSDTAGMREASSHVEQEGIRRARDRAQAGHLVVWLDSVDNPAAVPAELAGHGSEILRVTNKSDLGRTDQGTANGALDCAPLLISTRTGQGLSELAERIAVRARDRLGETADVVPSRSRHTALLAQALGHFDRFRSGPDEQLELRAEDLRQAAMAIGRLTGRIDVEDVLDQIFSRFCIGK
jgi:tRNA modification GTPase